MSAGQKEEDVPLLNEVTLLPFSGVFPFNWSSGECRRGIVVEETEIPSEPPTTT